MTNEQLNVFGDLTAQCDALAVRSPIFAAALDVIGAPVVRRRPGGFEGLFRIIVEQQVSVPSAQAILARINDALDMSDVEAVRAAGVEGLRDLGLSRPKAGYVAGLAALVASDVFCFDALAALDDPSAADRLRTIKGVGPWTASIYLLFCEGRVDIWPPSDVALKGAFNHARQVVLGATKAGKGADQFVDQRSLDAMAADWAPQRGIAAHILWTYYAHIKGRAPI